METNQEQIPAVTAQEAVSLSASFATDALVARHAMGWEWLGYPKSYWVTPTGGGRLCPRWSVDVGAAWEVVEAMVGRMGYNNLSFEWYGPCFKPEHHYLTAEGYPLGTTCWYVRIETRNYALMIPADTAALAVCRSALVAVAVERDPGSDDAVIDWTKVRQARNAKT